VVPRGEDRGVQGTGTPTTPRRAAALAFVADLRAPRLTASDHHHLARVLRLGPGHEIAVGDGSGGWRAGRVTDGVDVEVTGEVVRDPRPAPQIAVAFALVKGGRPEPTVQKLTEVGVDRIVPFVAERSVVRWDAARAERRSQRLGAIARAAAMQCRRTWLPVIEPVATFAEAAGAAGATLADLDGDPPSLERPVVLVGPEGGWSPVERGRLPRTRLGAHVFRTETAAITAGALLVALRENLVVPLGE
jgi:16S rRNA (uracil1498-N3)-methyltransferase